MPRSPYAAVYKTLEEPGDSRPTALQIIQDEELEGKLQHKVVFITGCSAGLGVIAASGSTRNRSDIVCECMSILRELLVQSKTLNILINKAGIMVTP